MVEFKVIAIVVTTVNKQEMGCKGPKKQLVDLSLIP
jgi:hypothetical protein